MAFRETAKLNSLPFGVFICVISAICEREWIPKILAEDAEPAEEAAEMNSLPFDVFICVISAICEREWIPKILAEDAEPQKKPRK